MITTAKHSLQDDSNDIGNCWIFRSNRSPTVSHRRSVALRDFPNVPGERNETMAICANNPVYCHWILLRGAICGSIPILWQQSVD